MDEMVIKALYIELLTAMLHNIEQASTERAHNHIKLMFALGELTGLRSQRVEMLPKWQTLALACWKALDGKVAFDDANLYYASDPSTIDWGKNKEIVRDFLGMFGGTTTTHH